MIIIDADSIIYGACYSVMKQMDGDDPPSNPVAAVKSNINKKIQSIIDNNPDYDRYLVVLSGYGNFRYDIYPDYKANRKDMERPDYYQEARDHLIKKHSAYVTEGIEADDFVVMQHKPDTVLAGIDKDLLQSPGKHYNFNKQEHLVVTEEEANRYLYTQALTGDTIDNIPGLFKLTGKKATKAVKEGINNCNTAKECWDYVCSVYEEASGTDWGEVKEKLITSMKCLYLLRDDMDMWEEPV